MKNLPLTDFTVKDWTVQYTEESVKQRENMILGPKLNRKRKDNYKRTVLVLVSMNTGVRRWRLKTTFNCTLLKVQTPKTEILRLCVSWEQLKLS